MTANQLIEELGEALTPFAFYSKAAGLAEHDDVLKPVLKHKQSALCVGAFRYASEAYELWNRNGRMKDGYRIKLDLVQLLIVQLHTALENSGHKLPCDNDPCNCWRRKARKVLDQAVAFERQRRGLATRKGP